MFDKPETKKIGLLILVIVVVIFISATSAAALLLNSSYFETGILEEQEAEHRYVGENFANQISVTETMFTGLEEDSIFSNILTTNHTSQAAVDTLFDTIDFAPIVDGELANRLFSDTVIYTTNQTTSQSDHFTYLSPIIKDEPWYDTISTSRRQVTISEIDQSIYVLYRIVIEDDLSGYEHYAITPLDQSILQDIGLDDYHVLITNIILDASFTIYNDKTLDKPKGSYLMFGESDYLDDEMLLIYDIVPGTSVSKWNLVIVTERINFITEFAQYTSAIFIGLSLILFVVFYRFNLIHKINKSFDTLSHDDIKSIIATNKPSKIEKVIKTLYEKVELLVQQNHELDIINKQKENEKNKAEIKALLSQISPHYIFNLLNSIHKRALKNNEMESAKMILLMSKQLRGSLEWKEPFVTIEDELGHINSYVKLEQYYYGSTFDFNYDLDKTLYKYKVPKLIFQTLIENALKHGVRDEPFYIQLKDKDEYISFSVTNVVDGKPKDVLAKIGDHSKPSDYIEGKGIGLQNMVKRLEYYYNSNYQIFSQTYKRNIAITIILPKNVKEMII